VTEACSAMRVAECLPRPNPLEGTAGGPVRAGKRPIPLYTLDDREAPPRPRGAVDVVVLGGGEAAQRTLPSLQRAGGTLAHRPVPAAEGWQRGEVAGGPRDVVLLRAGTEVFEGWLDRLHAAVYADP